MPGHPDELDWATGRGRKKPGHPFREDRVGVV